MNKDIYNTLKHRIVFLEYPPGHILKEQALADEFGVSRTPLRTVLSRLEWEHLIKILPRTGILVMELELNTITNVFQARLEIESVIGTMAARQFSPAHHKALAQLEIDCRALSGRKAPKDLGLLDMRIKKLFHDACGNPYLVEMSDRLYTLTFRLWYFTMLKMSLGDWQHEVRSVEEDVSALTSLMVSQDPAKVGEARKTQLLKHLKRIRATFLGLSGFE